MTTAAPRRAGDAARATTSLLLVVAIVVLALNMRGPFVAVSTVLDEIRADLAIGAGTAGLFTSLPVLCFGLATPLASALLARAGLERGVLTALVLLLAGTVVRSLDGLPLAITGTIMIGIGITVGNVAVPMVIGRDVASRHAGLVLGIYTSALNVGSLITLSLTVPIANAVGWRWALLVWGALVVIAIVVWKVATRGGRGRAEPAAGETAGKAAGPAPDADPGAPIWWRRPAVWGLTLAFVGQAFAYFGVTAWLPQLLRDEIGMDAGAAGVSSSIFQIAGIAGAFGVPLLLRVFRSARPAMLTVCAAWFTLPLGLILAPQHWALWCALGGAAQGGGLTVIFALIVRKSRGLTESRHFSATVQGGGYLVAAAGPAVIGAVHEATGTWTVPMLVVLASLSLLTVAGTLTAGGRPAKSGSVSGPRSPTS